MKIKVQHLDPDMYLLFMTKNYTCESAIQDYTIRLYSFLLLCRFGGINASHLYNDIWYFDLVAHTWHQISAVGYIPAPRESCGAALVDDTIYIFGGRGLNGCGLGDLCAFRIKSEWIIQKKEMNIVVNLV